MKDLIIADITRIFRKPSYCIAVIVCICISLIWAIRTKMNVWNGFTFMSEQDTALDLCGYILGISIYLSVYADEFSSNSMQCLIGHGVSRFRLLLAKFIDCVIVTFVTFLVYTCFVLLLGLVLSAGMNASELKFICGMILIRAIKSLGYATFSMIVLYWTQNVGLATFTDVFLLFTGSLLLSVFDVIPVIKFYRLGNYFFEGILSNAYASLQLGQGSAWLWLTLAIVRICVFSIFVSFLLFRKKELEF